MFSMNEKNFMNLTEKPTMTRNRWMICWTLTSLALIGASAKWAAAQVAATAPAEPLKLLEPKPLVPGAKVVTLWPAGSPMLKALAGWDQPEGFNMTRGNPSRVESVVNIHNPSIELHLAPPDKANGMAVIVAAGGGNITCNVGPEGTAIADWLNSLGIHAFIERYRLRPYSSVTDGLADTQRCFRIIRANARNGAWTPSESESWDSPPAANNPPWWPSTSIEERRMQPTPSSGSVAARTLPCWYTPAGEMWT
jgi:hypothetical protein